MIEKAKRKLRTAWHDAYYGIAGNAGIDFAMRCRDVARIIDMHEVPNSVVGKLRYGLHLSLCKACQNYYDLAAVLHVNINGLVERRKPDSSVVEQLNQSLLNTFARRKP